MIATTLSCITKLTVVYCINIVIILEVPRKTIAKDIQNQDIQHIKINFNRSVLFYFLVLFLSIVYLFTLNKCTLIWI